jgi:TP901-1 family phage major tail protein
MAAELGRELILNKNAAPVAGLRTKGLSFNSEPVDVTTDDDNGYRTLLAEAGQVSLDISFDGIEKDAVLRDLYLAGGTTQQYTDFDLAWPDGSTLTGNFNITAYEETGTYNDAITFTCSLQSSGTWTYTPAP